MANRERRLNNEIKRIFKAKEELEKSNRIYFDWNQEDLNKAKAMIMGPPGFFLKYEFLAFAEFVRDTTSYT